MRRAEQKEHRRTALFEGALAVLSEHGLEGFTTGRVAKAAGIGQSGFYVYFRDRDECLIAVASKAGERLLEVIRTARLRAGNDGFVESFAGALQAMLDERATLELLLRYRREPGPLGDQLRALVQQGLQELHTDIVALGLFEAGDPLGHRMARYCVAVTIGAVEALVDGEVEDVRTVAEDLARIAASVLAMGQP